MFGTPITVIVAGIVTRGVAGSLLETWMSAAYTPPRRFPVSKRAFTTTDPDGGTDPEMGSRVRKLRGHTSSPAGPLKPEVIGVKVPVPRFTAKIRPISNSVTKAVGSD